MCGTLQKSGIKWRVVSVEPDFRLVASGLHKESAGKKNGNSTQTKVLRKPSSSNPSTHNPLYVPTVPCSWQLSIMTPPALLHSTAQFASLPLNVNALWFKANVNNSFILTLWHCWLNAGSSVSFNTTEINITLLQPRVGVKICVQWNAIQSFKREILNIGSKNKTHGILYIQFCLI